MRELSKRDMKSVSGGDGLGLNYSDVPGFLIRSLRVRRRPFPAITGV